MGLDKEISCHVYIDLCGNRPSLCDRLERNGMAVVPFKQVSTALLKNCWVHETYQNLL